jgi:hypothetical protein
MLYERFIESPIRETSLTPQFRVRVRLARWHDSTVLGDPFAMKLQLHDLEVRCDL